MLEDFFLIPLSRIDSNWLPIEFADELFALEYCEEVLDIPLYYIDEASFTKEGLEISLKHLENSMAKEDWYIQLNRLSSYARAS